MQNRTPSYRSQDKPLISLHVYVATHVHDRLSVKREQLPQERLVTALAGRVDDERTGSSPVVAWLIR